MAIAVERVELAVTVVDPGGGQVPSWRDTIRVEVTGSALTSAQLSALRAQATTEARARHDAWLDAITNPPAPEPEPVVSRDEALVAAADALQQALDAVNAASVEL